MSLLFDDTLVNPVIVGATLSATKTNGKLDMSEAFDQLKEVHGTRYEDAQPNASEENQCSGVDESDSHQLDVLCSDCGESVCASVKAEAMLVECGEVVAKQCSASDDVNVEASISGICTLYLWSHG